LLGRRWSAPFGIAPIGLANLLWPGNDTRIAEAAVAEDIPYTLSTAGTTRLEAIARIAPEHAWFQLYVGADDKVVWDIVDRAERSGYEVLFVTVDVPAPGRRLRDLRNGFQLPLKPTVRLAYEVARHPAWALATLRAGSPRFANLEPYMPPSTSTQSLAAFMASQVSGRLDWELLRRLRQRWKGRLVVKGLINPTDAVAARDLGADAIVVSNHGGRQLEGAPATLDVLPGIRRALGPDFPVMIDGGVRSGEDIAKALALGADFVLLGRAIMYAAATSRTGAREAIALVKAELDNALAQMGRCTLADLGPDAVTTEENVRQLGNLERGGARRLAGLT